MEEITNSEYERIIKSAKEVASYSGISSDTWLITYRAVLEDMLIRARSEARNEDAG